MGFYNDGPDVPDYHHHSRCRVVFSVSFDASGGVVLHGFLPWFFLILSAVVNRAGMRRFIRGLMAFIFNLLML